MKEDWLDAIKWDDRGLVPAITQENGTGKILMMAWMNREALGLTRETGHAVYWSRSRGKLWHKGDTSGHVQRVKEIFLDCDADTVLLKVEQVGGAACHEGYASCFYRRYQEDGWQVVGTPVFDPKEVYQRG